MNHRINPTSRHARTMNRGFTLIELLVVVAIIITLLAILLPSMGRALYVAQTTVCLSNVKQQYVAQFDYATDNIGAFPKQYRFDPQYVRTSDDNSGWWAALHTSYLPSAGVLTCPVINDQSATPSRTDPTWTTGQYGGWETTASHILIPYAWMTGFDYTPAPGEPAPPLSVSSSTGEVVVITHRSSVSSPASWDLGHGGVEYLAPSTPFEEFKVTDSPLGFGDGAAVLNLRSEMRLRLTHTASLYAMDYYY